jgi:hypothetical protein
MLFDLVSRRWRELASDTTIYAVGIRWSFDSRYVHFQDFHRDEEQPILRVGVSGGKVEQVASSRP